MSRPADIRLSFNRVAKTYAGVRPTYPAALLDDLFAMLPPGPEVVEVGPGTGQATKDLLARGAFVHAIEIGPAMAEQLQETLGTDRLRVTVGDFEEVNLEAASADVVFSASAYHWITPGAQTDRPAHVLRRGGVLAVVDLIQVSSPVDHGFFAAAQPIYERYGEGHKGPPPPERDAVDPPIRATLAADSRFRDIAVRRYDWDQSYSADEYRKLMVSFSGTQMMDETSREGLLDDIQSFLESEFGGRLTRPLVATLTTGVLDVKRRPGEPTTGNLSL